MILKEKVKMEIEKLSEKELEKVFLYLSKLRHEKKSNSKICALKLGGKLDNADLRKLAYE